MAFRFYSLYWKSTREYDGMEIHHLDVDILTDCLFILNILHTTGLSLTIWQRSIAVVTGHVKIS
jgi:hypothetical protein